MPVDMYSNGYIEISKHDGRVLDACAHGVARMRVASIGRSRLHGADLPQHASPRLHADCMSTTRMDPVAAGRTRCNPSARCRVPLIAQATKPAAASKAGNEPAKNAKASNKTKQAEAAATGTAAEVCAHMQQSFRGPRGTLDALPCFHAPHLRMRARLASLAARL